VINNLFSEMMQEISAKNLLNESIVSPIKNETLTNNSAKIDII